MEAIAKAKYLRCSARKVRAVADLIRQRPVGVALSALFALKKSKKSAELLDSVLKSAVANFREKHAAAAVDTDKLMVSTILVDGGPIIKRIRPRSQGKAYRIHKNLCHITVQVTD
jgi:large subunit ribosomal protein L22